MSSISYRHRFKKLFLILFVFLLYLCYTGLKHNEIGELHIVRLVGIDYKESQYIVSILFNDYSGNINHGYKVRKASGNTVYEAFEQLSNKTSNEISIAHTSFYLLSLNAARTGLNQCLDYLSRNPMVKTSATVYLFDQPDLSGFLEKQMKDKVYLHETLSGLLAHQNQIKKEPRNTLVYVLNGLRAKYHTILIPYLNFDEDQLYLGGYTICLDGVYTQSLDFATSQLIDFLTNNLSTCPLYLSNQIGLKLSQIQVQMTPKWENKQLTLAYTIRYQAKLQEDSSILVDVGRSIQELKLEQITKLRQRMDLLYEIIHTNELDLLGIEPLLLQQESLQDIVLQDNFPSVLANLRYETSIEIKMSTNEVLDY